MTTAAAPVDTTGGSAASVDPIDTLDLTIDDGVTSTSDFALPDSMVIGANTPESEQTDDGTAADRGDGRTKDGRFAGKPGEPEGETEAVAPMPFQYRAMGKTHGLEGAQIDPASGNLTIPAAKVADVQEAFNALELAKGEYIPVIERHRQNNAQLRQRVQELETAQGAKEAQAQTLVDALTAAFSEPDEERSLAALWQMRQSFPLLLEKARSSHLENQLKTRTAQPPAQTEPQATAPSAQQSPAQIVDEARSNATDTVERWKIHPEFRDVTKDAWGKVEQAITSRPLSFLRPATAEDAKQYPGVTEGEMVFDRSLLHAEVQMQRDAIKASSAQAKLARDNATRTQPSITAPPTPGGGRAPVPKSKTPQTKEELDRWFDSDSLD